MVSPTASTAPPVETLADNDPIQPSTDNPTTPPDNTIESPNSKTYTIRFIVKHSGRTIISMPSLLKDFLSTINKNTSSFQAFDHHHQPITISNFPSDDEFKNRFNGGESGHEGIYFERLFNGASTVTWITVTTPYSFNELTSTTRTWLKDNGVFLDLAKTYRGPREIVGMIFGLNTKHTHRDTLMDKITSIANPHDLKEFELKSNTADDSLMDDPPMIPYLPELKLAPFYHTTPTSDTTKRTKLSCILHWLVVPVGLEYVFTCPLLEAYHHKSLPGTFIPRGLQLELNPTQMTSLIRQQNELQTKTTTIPLFYVNEEVFNYEIQIKTTNGPHTSTKETTIRDFLNQDHLFHSIEATKDTASKGKLNFICSTTNILRARNRLDKFIDLFTEQIPDIYRFKSKTPSRDNRDIRRQPPYQKLTTHTSFLQALTANIPTDTNSARAYNKISQPRPRPIQEFTINSTPTPSPPKKQPKTNTDQLELRFQKIEESIDKLVDAVNKLINKPVPSTTLPSSAHQSLSTITTTTDYRQKLLTFDPSLEPILTAMENNQPHPNCTSDHTTNSSSTPPTLKRKTNHDDIMELEHEVLTLDDSEDPSTRQTRLNDLTREIQEKEQTLSTLKTIVVNMNRQLLPAASSPPKHLPSPTTNLTSLTKGARNETKRTTPSK